MLVREGPVQHATRLGITPSTIHRVPTTARRNRLLYLDRATGEEVCRYEYPRRWRLAFCRPPRREEEPHSYPSKPKSRWHNPYSCVAYAEIHGDETAIIAVTVLHRAVEWFGERGVSVELVLTENGGGVPVLSVAGHVQGPVDCAEADPPVPPGKSSAFSG